MQNKVRWQRQENGTAIPYVFECTNNHWCWKPYTSSKVYTPDKGNFSKGYLTFLNALKLNYIVETNV